MPLLVCAIGSFKRHENSGPRSVWTLKQHARASDLLKSPDLCSLWTSEQKGGQLSAIKLSFYLSASTSANLCIAATVSCCKKTSASLCTKMGHTNKHITTCTSSHSELWLKLCLRNLHDNAVRITGVLHDKISPGPLPVDWASGSHPFVPALGSTNKTLWKHGRCYEQYDNITKCEYESAMNCTLYPSNAGWLRTDNIISYSNP